MLGMAPLLEDILHIEQVSRSGVDPGDIGERLVSARRALDLGLDALRRDRGARNESGAAQAGIRSDGPRRGQAGSGLRRA